MARRHEEILHPAQERSLDPARDGEVEVGERVTVLDLTTGAVSDLRIVVGASLDPSDGQISPASPLGSALVGRHVGDVVKLASRSGYVHYEVVEIDG